MNPPRVPRSPAARLHPTRARIARFCSAAILAATPCCAALAQSAAALPNAALPTAAPQAAPLQTIPSMPLAAFQHTLGINLHMEYTDGKYADAAQVLSDLDYLGIRNARDYIPNPTAWQPPGQALHAVQSLAAHGIRFDFIADGNASLPVAMHQLDTLLQAYPGLANSVEGPNEINNFPVHLAGKPNQQGAELFQRALYAAVHSDPLLHGVPVYSLTGAAPVDLHTHPGLADLAVTHPYPHHGEQPYTWLNRDFPTYFTLHPGDPRAITETGYYTQPLDHIDPGGPNGPGSVDEPSQAALVLNTYFDSALQGNSYTYLYQLLDAYPDPKNNNSDNHYGLFHLDGSPKPAATALHRLALALPPDQPSPQRTVQAAIAQLPASAHALALTGSNGSIALFLWNESPLWNPTTHTAIPVAPIPIPVTLPGSWTVHFFAPTSVTSTNVTEDANGAYPAFLCSYPTALLFEPK